MVYRFDQARRWEGEMEGQMENEDNDGDWDGVVLAVLAMLAMPVMLMGDDNHVSLPSHEEGGSDRYLIRDQRDLRGGTYFAQVWCKLQTVRR